MVDTLYEVQLDWLRDLANQRTQVDVHLANPVDVASLILAQDLKLHQLLLHRSFLLVDKELRYLPELVLKRDVAVLWADDLVLVCLNKSLVLAPGALE